MSISLVDIQVTSKSMMADGFLQSLMADSFLLHDKCRCLTGQTGFCQVKAR